MVYPSKPFGQLPIDEANYIISSYLKEYMIQGGYIHNEYGIFGNAFNHSNPLLLGTIFDVKLEKIQQPFIMYGFKICRVDTDLPDVIDIYDGYITNHFGIIIDYPHIFIEGNCTWWLHFCPNSFIINL